MTLLFLVLFLVLRVVFMYVCVLATMVHACFWLVALHYCSSWGYGGIVSGRLTDRSGR